MGYRAVRTAKWKYVHYTELQGMDELYDLERDPYEMNNVIGEKPAALAEMQKELARLTPSR
jgi:arylsulfatase A-like enzyme